MPLHHVKSHYNIILYYTSTYVERVGLGLEDFPQYQGSLFHPFSAVSQYILKVHKRLQYYAHMLFNKKKHQQY
jgi:hypothetical protein